MAILNPFWGMSEEDPGDPSSGRFDAFVAEGPSFLELTEFELANVVVFPVPWELAKDSPDAVESARRLARVAAEHDKPLLIFFWSDSTEPVPVEPCVVFRTSTLASSRRPNEFAMPAWSEDFVERYLAGAEAPRPRSDRPVVGFCGFENHRSTVAQVFLRHVMRRSDVSVRTRALATLAAGKGVDTRFVVRDRFYGGSVLASGRPDYGSLQQARREFVENLIEIDYGLALRGAGNFSYRLYEILSCGRVPLFVNTDCLLPLERELDWKRFTVWVEDREIDSVARRLVEFHDRLDDEAFLELQHECRRVWLDCLSPQGFFRHLHLHFRPDGEGHLRLKPA